ncbi:MAG: hypothetical protein HY549_00510 [Elusimicrobia bacterium]|nr:hypothetical protein [Elusimicrobiota bacterium]
MRTLVPENDRPARARLGPVLLCAATGWEAAPVARRLNLRQSRADRFTGKVSGKEIALLKMGMGGEKAAASLRSFGAQSGQAMPDLVCSIGYCGALQPGIRPGELVADVQGAELDCVQAIREAAATMGLPVHFGRILSSALVLGPEEKARWGSARRAVAVDMESSSIRAWAEELQRPFLALRVVFDELHDALPARMPRDESLAEAARYAFGNILLWPQLARLALRQGRCAKRLAAFLERLLERL